MSPRTVRCIVSGASLQVVTRGSGPTVLLIHGGAEDATGFEVVADLLAEDFTVVTYDRRGNSRSERGPGWPRIGVQRHVDDAVELLQQLRAAPATCYGGSSGAIIALMLTSLHPESVSATVAFEPPLLELGPHGHAVQEKLLARTRKASRGPERDYVAAYGAFARSIRGGGAGAFDIEAADAEVFIEDDLGLMMTSHGPDLARVTASGIPVTIAAGVWGMALLGEVCCRIATDLGTAVTWINSGHAVHRTCPELLAGLIRGAALPRSGAAERIG